MMSAMPRCLHRLRVNLWLVALLVASCGEPGVIQPPEEDTGPTIICEPLDKKCSGQVLYTCNPYGTEYYPEPCEHSCKAGKCVDCVPNTHICTGAKLATHCDEAGTAHPQVCDHGCLDGECVAVVCDAGRTFCNETLTQIQRCTLDGLHVEDVGYCPYECDPTTATCKDPACAEGDTRCSPYNPDALEVCNAQQTAYEAATYVKGDQELPIICAEKCESGKCWVSACTPGTYRCGNKYLEKCKSDGTGYTPFEECSWGCLDNGGGQAMCALCLPGAYACKGNTVVHCNEPQYPWTTVMNCGDLDSCVGGTCLKVLKLTDSHTVKEKYLLLIQAMAECWLTWQSGSVEKDLCRSLDTTEMSDPISKESLGDWFCDVQDDTVTIEDFSTEEAFEAAVDLIGCGILNPANLTFETFQEQVNPGMSLVECIAFKKKEILVQPCASVEK